MPQDLAADYACTVHC